MAPKRKSQITLKKMFGWESTSKPIEEIVENAFDLNKVADQPSIEVGDECNEVEASSNRKQKVRRVFRAEWRLKFPWVRCTIQGESTIMKCEWCEKYKIVGPWGSGNGCVTLQHDALATHAVSSGHKLARAKWMSEMEKEVQPISQHDAKMHDANKERIITTMKLMYFTARQDLSISTFEALCSLAISLDVPKMPKMVDYSSYTNRKAGADFLMFISDHLLEVHNAKMLESPYYSIMVDESTDRTLEQHLVIYGSFIDKKGFGQKMTQFLMLVCVLDGKGKTILHAVLSLIESMGLKKENLVAIATDGASSMVGSENGLVSLLRKDVPHLLGIHCIAHREALAAGDASKKVSELLFVDKFVNKVYSWIGKSARRNAHMMSLLELMQLESLHVLQIHSIRWLSRGAVIVRLVTIMPAILSLWKREKEANWYKKACTYVVQFSLHLLADVLTELNILNKKFQEEHIDLTSLGTSIDVVINSLSRNFLRDDNFSGTKYLSKFLEVSNLGYLEIIDSEGIAHRHDLHFVPVPHAREDLTLLPRIDGSLDSCKKLAKDYVLAVIDCLNSKFLDLPLFNATKLFSPCYYAEDSLCREANTKRWLEKLISHLHKTNENNGHIFSLFDVDGCRREVHSFVDTLFLGCEGFSMKDAWRVFSLTKDWQESFPNMTKLWQIVLVIPASIVICERGFSKQNAIKDIRRSKLSIATLDYLMMVSLNGPEMQHVEWDRVYELWKDAKDRRVLNV